MPRVTVTEKGEAPQPYRLKLEREIIKIGRALDNDVKLSCGSISSLHCEIRRVKGGYILEDLDSTNGLKQDGTKFQIIDLFDGTEASIGDVALEFQLTEEEREELDDEGDFQSRQRPSFPDKSHSEEAAPSKPSPPSPPQPAQAPASEPVPTNALPPNQQPVIQVKRVGTNPLLFLILGIVAIFLGMSVRHYMDNDSMLHEKLLEAFGK